MSAPGRDPPLIVARFRLKRDLLLCLLIGCLPHCAQLS